MPRSRVCGQFTEQIALLNGTPRAATSGRRRGSRVYRVDCHTTQKGLSIGPSPPDCGGSQKAAVRCKRFALGAAYLRRIHGATFVGKLDPSDSYFMRRRPRMYRAGSCTAPKCCQLDLPIDSCGLLNHLCIRYTDSIKLPFHSCGLVIHLYIWYTGRKLPIHNCGLVIHLYIPYTYE